MRDVNRLERAIILLALYVWQWLEALEEYADIVRENRRGLRRGAADEDWQHTLRLLAAPVRAARMRSDTGELPPMGLYKALGEVVLAEWSATEGSTVIEMVTEPAAPALPLAVPVVTGAGVVTETLPHAVKPHIRKHRKPTRAAKATVLKTVPRVAAVRAAERRIRKQLDIVFLEAMQAAGWTAEEALAIFSQHEGRTVMDRMAVA